MIAAQANQCLNYYRGEKRVFHQDAPKWLIEHSEISSQKILDNISPSDALPGAIIAARTRQEPNYYFHWIRDAALVMESIVGRRSLTSDPAEIKVIDKKISEYVEFSKRVQSLPTPAGLGEPKVNVDGTVFAEPWGRPQNDSPALRAVSLLKISKIFKKKNLLNSMIKTDLDYVADQWRKPSFDLWEEVEGYHFYTLMVQRKALTDGAEWAKSIGDTASEKKYREQKYEIEKTLLQDFWNKDGDYIPTTSFRTGGMGSKHSNLDIAVVLALLHGSTGDGVFKYTDPKFLKTLESIEARFKNLYAINNRNDLHGVAIGRYPEDVFAGHDFSGGNPWVLATLAMAEAYYHVARELKSERNSNWQNYMAKGDTFVHRVERHANPDGSLSEQMHRDSGFMTSVSDLTWSHSAVLTATKARGQLQSR